MERSTTIKRSAKVGETKRCTASTNKQKKYQKEDDIDKVNINSINFNSKHLVRTAKLETSPDQARVWVPH